MRERLMKIKLDLVKTRSSSGRCYVYSPGDIISGSVLFKRSQPISELYLECFGGGKMTNIAQGGCSENKEHNFMVFEGDGIMTIPLKTDDSDPQGQASGGLKIPFKFTLPQEIPSTYEGKLFNVEYSYSIQAVVKFDADPIQFYSDLVYFQVAAFGGSSNDLPPRKKISKYCGILMQQIKADAWLDKREYALREKIIFNAKIDGYGGKSVSGSTVQLIQYITSSDKEGKLCQNKRNILWERRHKTAKGDRDIQVWNKIPIHIQSHWAPSSLEAKKPFFNTTYVIKLTIDPGFLFRNLVIRFDVGIRKLTSVEEGQRYVTDLSLQQNYTN